MNFMETKILGIILSILGISGLILALINVNGAVSPQHIPLLFTGGVFGAIAFFAGIWMVPNGSGYNKTSEVNVNRAGGVAE
jgi:hypothetical protein